MYDYVPQDILEKILHRLPPKSIGRCMAVCKSWNFLIKKLILSAPDIVEEILRRLPPRSILNCMAVCRSWNFLVKKRISSIPLFLLQHSDDRYFLCSPNIQCSYLLLPHDSIKSFVGALNGVVCFTSHNNFKTRISLFNPLRGRVLKLPTSPMMDDYTYLHLGFSFEFGFCFDSKKNDFKVISICYSNDIRVHPVVELYSVNQGAWRVINASSSLMQPSINLSDPELYYYRIVHCGQQVFYQGNVHWLARKKILYRNHEQRQPSIIYYILIFNVVEEKFNEMVLPDVLANFLRRLDITVIDGCLSLIQYLPGGSCYIWMKRESWSNIQSVYLSEGKIEQLLGQNKSSEVLVLPHSSWPGETVSLHSYDLKSQRMRDLGVESTFIRLCASDLTYNLSFLDKKSNGEG
ncbi:F-box/kelch-repeat protein At3g23880-like [Gastrolobium bilobum]|uniref:F-box/kelch-repeat protein At3g23880-like n=1 Tax=Gastrolobium bilobum TaxID=150636 RepID=UPI002AB0F2BD|nr:F-box/kelch-repeat protein At3g23880-like [Gastrolobium bilobum]